MLLIKNATIVLGEYVNTIEKEKQDYLFMTDILVKDGKIIKIQKNIFISKSVRRNLITIDAEYKYVIPGIVDPHCHMRDPGFTNKEDFITGSKSCIRGGVTTFLDMPNTSPLTITKENLELKRKNSLNRSYSDYGFHFGGSKEDNSSEISQVSHEVASTKIFLNASTGDMLIEDNKVLENIFFESSIVSFHAEDEKVKTAIDLSEKFNAPIYLCHISTEKELEFIKKAKMKGLSIFSEVTPHHLFLNERSREISDLNNKLLRMKPELKTSEDNESLWEGLDSGLIDVVGTDHAPHTLEEKLESTVFGIPGVEHSLEMMLNGVNEKKITMYTLIRAMSINPAKIFKIKNKGKIEYGYDGDFIILDMDEQTTITNDEVISKCGWTPYNGMKRGGKILTTILRGNIVYDKGIFFDLLGKEVEYKK